MARRERSTNSCSHNAKRESRRECWSRAISGSTATARCAGCYGRDAGSTTGFEVAACVRARSILSRWDVVHFHVAEPLLMLMAARGPARLYYTHRGGAFQYELKSRLRYKAAGAIMRGRFAGMAGNTAHAADVAADLFAMPRARIGVVYNGIDWDILRPERDQRDVRAELDVHPDAVLLGTSAQPPGLEANRHGRSRLRPNTRQCRLRGRRRRAGAPDVSRRLPVSSVWRSA